MFRSDVFPRYRLEVGSWIGELGELFLGYQEGALSGYLDLCFVQLG